MLKRVGNGHGNWGWMGVQWRLLCLCPIQPVPQAGEMECQMLRDSVSFSSISWLCPGSFFREGLLCLLECDPAAAAGSNNSSSNYVY